MIYQKQALFGIKFITNQNISFRGVFRIQSIIYDVTFFVKIVKRF